MNYSIMTNDTKNSLEERAKSLLRYQITKEGEVPNPFDSSFLEEINYLLKQKYIFRKAGTIDQPIYGVTSEGKKWALASAKIIT